jgi:hypothetical protein
MMLEKDLISFEYQGLNQSEVSLIHDHARVIDELWKDGRLNITGIIPKQSLLKNLGNLKDKLLTEIEDEIEELEANEPDFTDFRNFEE